MVSLLDVLSPNSGSPDWTPADQSQLANLRLEQGQLYRGRKALFALEQVRAYSIERCDGEYLSLQAAVVALSKDAAVMLLVLLMAWLLTRLLPAAALQQLQYWLSLIANLWLLGMLLLLLGLAWRRRAREPSTTTAVAHYRVCAHLALGPAPRLVCALSSEAGALLLQHCLQRVTHNLQAAHDT